MLPTPVLPPCIDDVAIADCDAEPIHTPGHVQPHGALIALDEALRVRSWSTNAPALMGLALQLGQPAHELQWSDALMLALEDTRLNSARHGTAALRLVESSADGAFDVVIHAHAGRIVVEFECSQAEGADRLQFLARSQYMLDTLKRRSDLQGILSAAVLELRALTGFDRVMAYRFHADDSGEVVAEARRADLESLLGMRYPASDIPAQARRMYRLSTLRLIANIDDAPVPVLGHPADAPLDMTYAVLRSVSPIHVEYLRNMGVRASMSISIVVDGRLWGLVACHHYAGARRIPYAMRALCDLTAQMLAAHAARIESAEREAHALRAAEVRARLAEALPLHDDLLAGMTPMLSDLAAMFEADGILVAHGPQRLCHGPDAEQAGAILASLQARDQGVERQRRDQWPADVAERIGPWVGVLGLSFDPAGGGWLLALRREQQQTVRWAGAPEKVYTVGPRGPRLSPRGSFAEWLETVAGSCQPWGEHQRVAARHLQSDLQRELLSRHADVERARVQMLAILGHDLRDPLTSIRMAAGVLERGAGELQHRLGARIRASSGRMSRLVTQMLDLSRLNAGRGLDVRPQQGDVIGLLRDLVDETTVAHPGTPLQMEAPDQALGPFDADRLAQAVGNLLSNARHHGTPSGTIRIVARLQAPQSLQIDVCNQGPPLEPALLRELFQPFKRHLLPSSRGGHRGLGLGLYIAHAIASEHGGSLAYHHEHDEVVFRLTLPGFDAAKP